eukprot:COSAG01_NODE_29005_length_647_cov_3.456204_1_plen_111_part_00
MGNKVRTSPVPGGQIVPKNPKELTRLVEAGRIGRYYRTCSPFPSFAALAVAAFSRARPPSSCSSAPLHRPHGLRALPESRPGPLPPDGDAQPPGDAPQQSVTPLWPPERL